MEQHLDPMRVRPQSFAPDPDTHLSREMEERMGARGAAVDELRKAWSSSAAAWDELAAEIDRQLAPATEWMLHAASLEPGDSVLELAAGPGTLTVLAADAVGAGGSVICSDFSEAMVEAARRRVAAAELHNVEFRVLDAEALDLPAESVDVALCRCGYMLM